MPRLPFQLVAGPGSKGRLATTILPYIPKDVPIVSPFIGGGAVEYALAQRGQQVQGYDIFPDMVNLHQQFIRDKDALIDIILPYIPLNTRDKFEEAKLLYERATTAQERAAFFLIVWKASRNPTPYDLHYKLGQEKNGGNTKGHYSYLRTIRTEGIWVGKQDFMITLRNLPDNCALYLDPPYPDTAQEDYYLGHKDFSHEDLAWTLAGLHQPWVMSYFNVPDLIQELYPNNPVIPIQKNGGAMSLLSRQLAHGEEVLILGNIPIDNLGKKA